jgi:hypothetical protein
MIAPPFVAATFAFGPLQWQMPNGWESLSPPASQGIDYVFEPIKRGGPVITVSHSPREPEDSLSDIAAKLAQDERDDGRTIEGVVKRPTCHGAQPGIDIEMAFGPIASQLFHVTMRGDTVYVLMYTYAPNRPQDPEVRKAIDSICPLASTG